MDEIVYAAAYGLLAGSGLYVGQRWARSNGHAVLLGLALTVAIAVVLFCLTIVVVVVSPASMDPRRMGVFLGGLLVFGWVPGIVATVSGRRRAVKAAARLF